MCEHLQDLGSNPETCQYHAVVAMTGEINWPCDVFPV